MLPIVRIQWQHLFGWFDGGLANKILHSRFYHTACHLFHWDTFWIGFKIWLNQLTIFFGHTRSNIFQQYCPCVDILVFQFSEHLMLYCDPVIVYSNLPKFLQTFGNTFLHDLPWSIIGKCIFVSSKQLSSVFMRCFFRISDHNVPKFTIHSERIILIGLKFRY